MNAPSGNKRAWRRVDGVLLLDKPLGMSSNAALQKARRLFSAAKAGHTGTLDPLATGLLPCCFGEATKFSADLLDADKIYEADLCFGVRTATGDAEGEVLERRDVRFGAADLLAALARFRGQITQVPPMHSALKRDGKPLYELARQGLEVERTPRVVTIHDLRLLAWSSAQARLHVACSKGTYIRTLAEDLGRALGCGAHLAALRRTGVGTLEVGAAVSLARLEELDEAARHAYLAAPDALLRSLPACVLDEARARRFAHGNPVEVAADVAARPGKCRVYDGERLLGIGELAADGGLHPRRLVAP